jgi:hypothetical protein
MWPIRKLCEPRFRANLGRIFEHRNFVPASTPSSIDNMSVQRLNQCAFAGTAEVSISYMKTDLSWFYS